MNTDFTQSRGFKTLLIIIAGIVLLCAGFSAGEVVGFHKASFAYHNGNYFYRTAGPTSSMAIFSDTHGVIGKVVNVALPTITVEDHDNTEKVVMVNNDTIVRYYRTALQPNNIAVGQYIVALGTPNTQSQIVASLIRILPPPSPR